MATQDIRQITREAPEIESRKIGLMDSAKDLADIPLDLPDYQIQGLTSLQQDALRRAGGMRGIGGDFDAARGYLGATIGQDPAAVQAAMDPFINQVVQGAQQDIFDQAAMQQNELAGNAVASGALGGSRAGVAQGIWLQTPQAGWDLGAQLRSQGYADAMNRLRAAASGIAGLAAQQQGLEQQGIGFGFDVGAREQAQGQAELDFSSESASTDDGAYRSRLFVDIYQGAPSSAMTFTQGAAPATPSPMSQLFVRYPGLSPRLGQSVRAIWIMSVYDRAMFRGSRPTGQPVKQAEQMLMRKTGEKVMSDAMSGIASAKDPVQLMNAMRGDERTMKERRQELGGIVGMKDANKTPESVVTLVQPVMQMREAQGAVDQGIGQVAQKAMDTPVTEAVQKGIMQPLKMQKAGEVSLQRLYEQNLPLVQEIYGGDEEADRKQALANLLLGGLAPAGLAIAQGTPVAEALMPIGPMLATSGASVKQAKDKRESAAKAAALDMSIDDLKRLRQLPDLMEVRNKTTGEPGFATATQIQNSPKFNTFKRP